VVLEHAYGGSLLACLLQQGPVGGLGDDVLPVEVRFQQGASYPVDDLMVIGQSRAGERRLFVGVRRSPVIGAGSASFVSLLADYLRMVVDDPAKFEADDWRLGLAVAAPHAASAEVRTLAWIARRQHRGRVDELTARADSGDGHVRQRLPRWWRDADSDGGASRSASAQRSWASPCSASLPLRNSLTARFDLST
jgi:hypothetical protein